MTVLTKPSITIKKTPLISDSRCDELTIDVQPSPAPAGAQTPRKRRHTAGVLFCMFIFVLLLILLGVITAMQIYEQLGSTNSRHLHYQGYCSIPLSKDMQMLESRKMALRWKEADALPHPEPDTSDLQVVGVNEDADMSAILREMLDINVDDSMERIAVYTNGHAVSFLHDFESNVTGIVDEERCFLMELDPESVLSPELFVVGLQAGDDFDVQLVRSSLRAVLPALTHMANIARGLADKCTNKPTYKLQKETGIVIRKRAADEPPHDYIQFAGRNVQQIQISNLPELLHYEHAHNNLD